MLKVVAVHLQHLGLKYATVDGSVNPKQRMDVVEEFNNNPKGPQVCIQGTEVVLSPAVSSCDV